MTKVKYSQSKQYLLNAIKSRGHTDSADCLQKILRYDAECLSPFCVYALVSFRVCTELLYVVPRGDA